MNIFANLGFGFGKFTDENGKRAFFPSVSGELQVTDFDGDFTNGLGITTNDGSWLFGQSALDQSMQSTHRQQSNWILSDEYKAGILLAITELTKASRVDVSLVVALPYATPGRMITQLKSRLFGEHVVRRHGKHQQRINITFPLNHAFMPENVSPVFVHILNQYGTPQRLVDSGTLYIGCNNVGSHTVELSTVIVDMDKMSFVTSHPQNRSEPGGMYSLTRSVMPMLRERFYGQKDRFTAHEIFEILRTNEVSIGNQKVEVSDIISLPRLRFLEKQEALCANNWASDTPVPLLDLWAFVASGGGAHIVYPYFQVNNFHNNILISDDPQWDVVEGMRRWHKMLFKEQNA